MPLADVTNTFEQVIPGAARYRLMVENVSDTDMRVCFTEPPANPDAKHGFLMKADGGNGGGSIGFSNSAQTLGDVNGPIWLRHTGVSGTKQIFWEEMK